MKGENILHNWALSTIEPQNAGTIKDFESGRHQLNAKALGELARAYQKAGLVLFFEDDNGDVGVRLKKKKEASE
jgi:hypothetical protein